MPTIMEEWPWAHVVLDSHITLICHYCLKRTEELLECSVCQYAMYCNHLCQKSAWQDHKLECNYISRCAEKVPGETVRLMSRILNKLGSTETTILPQFSTVLSTFRTWRFVDLPSERMKIFKDDCRSSTFSQYCCELQSIMYDERCPSTAAALEIYGKVAINAILIQNDDMNPVALGIFLNISQVRHSCRPNSVLIFDGAKAYLNCLEDIKITRTTDINAFTVSYDSLIEQTDFRRRTLYSRYYFICNCDRCCDANSDDIATSLKCPKSNCDGHVVMNRMTTDEVEKLIFGKNKNTMKLLKTATGTCRKCGTFVKNLWPALNMNNKTNRTLESLVDRSTNTINLEEYYNMSVRLEKEQKSYLHPDNVGVIKTKLALANAAYCLGKLKEALNLYTDILPRLQLYVPDKHPMIGVLHVNVGRLCRKHRNPATAKKHFAEAVDIFRVSHGTAHPVYLMTIDWLRKCEVEEAKQKQQKSNKQPPGRFSSSSEPSKNVSVTVDDDDSSEENEEAGHGWSASKQQTA